MITKHIVDGLNVKIDPKRRTCSW